ncbi:MAG TPA: aldo/keto reductase [Candidatus Binatia bacterium]|nr:aldo/keto reductase [Candidatus Binatia bacterium]
MTATRVPLRDLGRTGLVVSRLGLGLAAVGRPGYINLGRDADLGDARTPDDLAQRSAELLDAALAAGIRYVDVARSYGRAEEFLRRWLDDRGTARDALVVGSKWGYRYTAGWRVDAPVHEEKEHSLARFRTQLDESRRILGDRLDLYQIHSATVDSGALADEALLAALVEERRGGAVRALGVTLSGPASERALELALAARVDGERVFDSVQATFNCLEPSLAGALAGAHREGVGVIAKEVHANGRLTGANRRPEDATIAAQLARIARAAGASPDQVALAWVLAHPFVDVALSGAATTAQLASHVAAAARSLPAEASEALVRLAEPRDVYWKTRARLPWS